MVEQQQILNGYTEKRDSERRVVGWDAAVPKFAAAVALYGFLMMSGIWSLSWMVKQFDLIFSVRGFLWLVSTSAVAGMAGAGMGGLFAIVVKDLVYKRMYRVESSTVRALPRMAAPTDAKPRALGRVMPNGSIRFGKEKMEVEQWLALATAIVEKGERQISQRKLANWGVVADRLGRSAQQIVEDLNYLEYVVGRGNDTYETTDELVEYLAATFPALRNQTPPPQFTRA